MTEVAEEIKDVTDYYKESDSRVLKAERKGPNTLILKRLDELYAPMDGRPRRFCIAYYWHPSANADQSSVQGDEYTYQGYRDVKGWQTKSLFDLFRLFP